jgi:hypothetical protein
MGIQDLGAIGEFISSLVIVVTLLVLIYEVRGAKNATLQANAQERQRRRDETNQSLAESPDLAGIQAAANEHLGGWRLHEHAAEFGLAPDQFLRLSAHYGRTMLQLRNAYLSGIPEEELESVDRQIQVMFSQPAFAKMYDILFSESSDAKHTERFLSHMDKIRGSVQAT